MALPGIVTLDPRLTLVFDLYDDCDLAADIGTDHAHLPAALLPRGRCRHMILTDISPDALNNARSVITRCGLADQVDFRLGDGLSPLKQTEKCRIISVTGMGGRTIRDILLSGREVMNGASLILSAHTDWHLIRRTIRDIGYHLDREEPCFDTGRYYLVLRACPGYGDLTDREIRLGKPLFNSSSPVLMPFLAHRKSILTAQLSGMQSAVQPDVDGITMLKSDIQYLEQIIRGLRKQEGNNDRS